MKSVMGLKILLVDDSSTILMMEKFILRNGPYEIVTATNGEEGVLKAAEQMPEAAERLLRLMVSTTAPGGPLPLPLLLEIGVGARESLWLRMELSNGAWRSKAKRRFIPLSSSCGVTIALPRERELPN